MAWVYILALSFEPPNRTRSAVYPTSDTKKLTPEKTHGYVKLPLSRATIAPPIGGLVSVAIEAMDTIIPIRYPSSFIGDTAAINGNPSPIPAPELIPNKAANANMPPVLLPGSQSASTSIAENSVTMIMTLNRPMRSPI
ncbi:hypothetical protein H113_05104 [Trichophyton rubrum MR1459]|uniref:Uncharacterized protein n=1 Tax=Trichophyton rubrum (strain ATCC MYA-4607 / CBS 118892) TaxID=559305 RepID=A0A080WHX0_TRIRC|nr:uncharacterized protein TERG_11902 [Trichophyton rubrum CBS 118892]EZF94165.1 hypothetical protein H113_05104 [Trichophyton rubrum MR1459]KFL60969.1 hypothetical protein TERG_11902 [Trichophyton rubrum CBS 118892]